MKKSSVLHVAGDSERSDQQAARLAELVHHLTGCSTDEALQAVSESESSGQLSNDEALERVARAIVRLRR